MLSFLRRKAHERSSLSKKRAETSFRVHDLCTNVTKNKSTGNQSPRNIPNTFRRKQSKRLAKGNNSSIVDNNCHPTVEFVHTPSCSFGDSEKHKDNDSKLAPQFEKDLPTLLAPRDFPCMDAHGSSFGSLDSSSSSGRYGDISINQLEERIFRKN
jgi:hypothetical protein